MPDSVNGELETQGRRAMAQRVVIKFEKFCKLGQKWYEVSAQSSNDGGLLIRFRDITDRKRVEDVLRRYELLAEHSRDIILSIRHGDWRILGANAAATAAYGYSREELLQLSITDLRAPETHGLIFDQMAEAEARTILFETIHRRKDGSTFPVEVSSQRADIGGARTLISVVRDITKRKRAEQALRESEQRFRSAVESFPHGFAIYDAQCRYVYLNAWCLRAAGLAWEQMVGRTDEELYPPEISRAYLPFLQLAIDTATPQSFDWKMPAQFGGRTVSVTFVPLLDGTGKVYQILAALHDITESRRTEEQLRRQAEELEAIMEIAPVAFWVSRDPQCRRIIGNRAGDQLYRTSRHVNVSQTPDPGESTPKFHFFSGGRELAPEELPMQQAAATGVDVRDVEVEVVHQDGTRQVIWGNACPLRDEQGSVRGALGAFLDVTDRKKVEDALRDSQADLHRAQAVAHTGSWRLKLPSDELLWSDEAHRIFGIPKGTRLTYDTFVAAIHTEDREFVRRSWEAALLGEPYDIEHRIIVGNEVKWVREKAELEFDGEGMLLGGFGTVQDITARKQAEETLRESEERYRNLVSVLPAAVYTCDASGIITFYNERAAELLGRRPRIGDSDERFCGSLGLYLPSGAPLSHMDTPMAFAIANGRGFRNEEVTVERPDGSRINVLVNIEPIRDARGAVIGATNAFVDITDLKRTEQALREANKAVERHLAQLEAVLDNITEGLVVADLDGSVFHWNPAAMAMHGFASLDECRRRLPEFADTFELSTVEDGVLSLEQWPLARILRGETLRGFEVNVRRRDTDWHRVFSYGGTLARQKDGTPLLAVVSVSDITARKRADEALRESEERFRLAFDHIPDTFVIYDSERRIEFINPAGVRICGFEQRDWRGKRDEELFPPAVTDTYLSRLKQAFETASVQQFEATIQPLDRAYTNLVTYVPVLDEAGRVRRVLGIAVDLTERQRIEEQLRHAQKLESIGVLAGGVAHDFNNLLTSVLGNASLAQLEAPPEIGERLNDIVSAAEKAAALTRQLLAYAGKGQFEISDFDLSEIIRSSADLIRVSIPKNVEITMDVPGCLPAIRGDSAQIQQVVMNLVINAAEAIGDSQNGTVSICAGVKNVGPSALPAAGFDIPPGKYVCLEVRDTGCGMDDSTIANIFDPFFTTKFTGRGLGLAAVQGILRSHKGGIVVRSTVGEGSRFTVYLPCVALRKSGSPSKGAESGPQIYATVLVVDDEPAVRMFAKAALEHLGHSVLLAGNGREALDFLSANGGIDLVLLDVVMPVIGGGETLAEIRKRWPEVAVLVTSGYTREEARRVGSLPCDLPFIEKPYTVQKLAAAVQSALEGHT